VEELYDICTKCGSRLSGWVRSRRPITPHMNMDEIYIDGETLLPRDRGSIDRHSVSHSRKCCRVERRRGPAPVHEPGIA
jgi:hypothetical protein